MENIYFNPGTAFDDKPWNNPDLMEYERRKSFNDYAIQMFEQTIQDLVQEKNRFFCSHDKKIIKIGKNNIFTPDEMKKHRPDLVYHIIETDARMAEETQVVQKELQSLMDLFDKGELKAPTIEAFSVEHTIEALHYLQQAKHKGKVVITYPKAFHYRDDASYLITGGTGGLGLELAKHFIAQGVKHLYLTSRSKASAALKEWMEAQKASGIDIQHVAVDVADKKGLSDLFESIKASKYPLKGIFHAAGMIRDGMLMNLKQEDFDAVLAPKVIGSSLLDELSQGMDLDGFVLFSSITSRLGNVGQANYSAANAYMDGLAKQHRQKGYPGTSINWGPFENVGMAKGLVNHEQQSALKFINTEMVYNNLGQFIKNRCAFPMVSMVYWDFYLYRDRPYLCNMIKEDETDEGHLTEAILHLEGAGQRDLMTSYLKDLLQNVLKLSDSNQLDLNKGFFEMGLDSIMAVELQSKLQKAMGKNYKIRNTTFFDYPSINKLTAYLLEEVYGVGDDEVMDTDRLLKELEDELKNIDR